MSRKPAPVWIARRGCSHFGLSAVERAVLMCLWDHADARNEAYPSAPTIAAETGFGDRAVKSALAELEQRGFTARAAGSSPRGAHSRHAVRYVLTTSPKLVTS
ncbi:helix-turn-helix domain-containing protein [Microbacterium sp. 22303]|uniref:helix-turn-helix domain-containing protein n=1 Tax=Microbacterium sp. 22303 TaxID=3453905 RepID=UPI003F853690